MMQACDVNYSTKKVKGMSVTKEIVFNLGDTGRVSTGVNRKDMNIQSYVDVVNSKETQELINEGDLYGYIGHEIREAFGDFPPDSIINPDTGESTPIQPAFRTISIRADNNGNVYCKHEFLDGEHGDMAKKMYASNVGGFSSVFFTKKKQGERHACGFGGFDYVKIPNYTKNRGNAQFDSVQVKSIDVNETTYDSVSQVGLALQQARVKAFCTKQDSIRDDLFAAAIIEDSANIISEQQTQLDRVEKNAIKAKERKKERAAQAREANMAKSTPFSEVQSQWDSAAVQIAGMETEYSSGKGGQKNKKMEKKRRNSSDKALASAQRGLF